MFSYLYYKCQKINPDCHGSYIDSLDWIENKKAAINSINKKLKIKYAVTVTLNYEEVRKRCAKNNTN